MANDVTISFKLPYALKMKIRNAAKDRKMHQTAFLLELVNANFNPQSNSNKLITHKSDDNSIT